MYAPTREQILDRWNNMPDILRDVSHSQTVFNEIDSIQKKYNLSDNKISSLGRLIRGVFYGLIHTEDLYKEIRDDLQVDPRLALEIYHEVDNKILSPFKKDIEENYVKSKLGTVKESEIIEPGQVSPQVVLKEKNPEIVDLKNQPSSSQPIKLKIEGTPSKPKEPEPVSLENIQINSSAQASKNFLSPSSVNNPNSSVNPVTQKQVGFNPNVPPTFAKPIINQENKINQQPASQPINMTNQPANSLNQTPNQSPQATPKQSFPEGPVILHKKEESQSIAQSQTIKNFAPSSFGGFFGSDMKSFGTAKPQNFVSSAKIEMPSQIKPISNQPVQKVPVVVKKYEEEPVKTVHFSNFKTTLDNQIKTNNLNNAFENSKTPVSNAPLNPQTNKFPLGNKPEDKINNNGGGMIDLGNLTIKK